MAPKFAPKQNVKPGQKTPAGQGELPSTDENAAKAAFDRYHKDAEVRARAITLLTKEEYVDRRRNSNDKHGTQARFQGNTVSVCNPADACEYLRMGIRAIPRRSAASGLRRDVLPDTALLEVTAGIFDTLGKSWAGTLVFDSSYATDSGIVSMRRRFPHAYLVYWDEETKEFVDLVEDVEEDVPTGIERVIALAGRPIGALWRKIVERIAPITTMDVSQELHDRIVSYYAAQNNNTRLMARTNLRYEIMRECGQAEVDSMLQEIDKNQTNDKWQRWLLFRD